ncbi:MAG: hypothetical protein LBD66_02440 [Holosporales bacterium]|nr:hypothetical protein [Holosporales bacterium]
MAVVASCFAMAVEEKTVFEKKVEIVQRAIDDSADESKKNEAKAFLDVAKQHDKDGKRKEADESLDEAADKVGVKKDDLKKVEKEEKK